MMTRALGIDYGAKRIGVAASDALGITATAIEVITERSIVKAAERVGELARERDVGILVFGMPYNMDGTEHASAARVRKFADLCTARTGLPVEFVDERLTTFEAENLLRETGAGFRKRKRDIDKVAAAVILRAWLQQTRP